MKSHQSWALFTVFALIALYVFISTLSSFFLFTPRLSLFNSQAASKLSHALQQQLPTHKKKRIVLAYCVYPQEIRSGEPVLGGEYMARVLGPLAFPNENVEFRSCLAIPDQLPRGVSPTSREGLFLLGLVDVHVRFCSFGVSALLDATLKRMDSLALQPLHALNSTQVQFLADHHVTQKKQVFAYVRKGSAVVVGPLLTRSSREPHEESVLGVPLQFETKAVNHCPHSLSMHMPYAFESFGRSRWNGNNASRVFEPHKELFGKNDMFALEESVTHRNENKFRDPVPRKFMAMVNSNCKSPPTAVIRVLFGYAVFQQLKLPVHNLGYCPLDPRGSLLAGVTLEERKQLKQHYSSGSKGVGTSVSDIFADYKFAICFENSNVEGYASEKIVTPYVAHSIPVYWGSGSLLHTIFNPRAFVHCNLPLPLTNRIANNFASFCSNVTAVRNNNNDAMECAQNGALLELMPHFQPCLDRIAYLHANSTAYEEMRREPLATVNDKGKLTGFWDENRYAKGIRAVFDTLGYEFGPEELNAVLL